MYKGHATVHFSKASSSVAKTWLLNASAKARAGADLERMDGYQ